MNHWNGEYRVSQKIVILGDKIFRQGYIGQLGPFWVPLDRFERLWLKNAVSQLVMWKTATRVCNIWILGTCGEYPFLKNITTPKRAVIFLFATFFRTACGARGKHFSREWSRWLQCERAEEDGDRKISSSSSLFEYQRKISEACKSSHNCDSAAPEKAVRRRTFIESTSAVEPFPVTDLQHNRLNLFLSSDLAFYLEPLFAESQLKHEYKHELCCNKRAKTW